MENPINSYYQAKKLDVHKTRNLVFSNLENRSHRLANGARKILKRKLQTSTTPTLGELVPWMLHDLLGTEIQKTREVAIGWLEIYLYTTLVDDLLDNERVPKAEELLAGSAMFQDGVLRLQKLVVGTKYEALLSEALFQAADYQIIDVLSQYYKMPRHKHEVAEGKNLVLLACAAAMAANQEETGDLAIEFTRSIVAGFQFLDDMADWEEDYKTGNYTKLIATAYQRLAQQYNRTVEFRKLPREQVFAHLIETGALTDLLRETKEIVNHSMLVASPDSELFRSSTCLFLRELYLKLDATIEEVERARENLYLPSNKISVIILERVENAIRIIAQSS